MNNKNLSQKLAHSHQSFMQTSKKNILKRRRQQFTNQHTQNEENNSFTHLNNSNTSKSLRELIVSQFHLKANESQLQDSLNMINSSDIKAVHHGIINIRQILIKDNSNLRQIVLDSTALDKILQFCQQEQYLHLKLEAAWCIANLTVGTTSQINILVKKNVIQILENVVQDQFGQIAEQGVWAIGNISSDDTKYRNLILKSNIVNILKQKLENTDSEMVKRIIWVFSNICQNSAKGEEATEQIYSLFDTIRRAFIAFDDLEIQKDCIAGIQAWMENENCRKQILQDQFLEKFLIYYSQLVKDTNQNIQQIGNCNRVLGMITSKDDEENQKILEFRFLTEIKKILVQSNLYLINQGLWIIGNIALSSDHHIQMIFADNELLQIIFQCTNHSHQNVVYEALWVINGFTKTSNQKHLNYILGNGLLNTLKQFMNQDTPEKLCLLALSSLKNLLEFFYMEQGEQNTFLEVLEDNGVIDQLEVLQTHQSPEVYNQIIGILEQYFEPEDQLTQ